MRINLTTVGQKMMDVQLQDLLERMMHQDPPHTNSEDSISFKAHRDVESVADPGILRAAREAVVTEKDRKKRDSLYFVICKVAANLDDQDAGPFHVISSSCEEDDGKRWKRFRRRGLRSWSPVTMVAKACLEGKEEGAVRGSRKVISATAGGRARKTH